jgi:hypothetical protein
MMEHPEFTYEDLPSQSVEGDSLLPRHIGNIKISDGEFASRMAIFSIDSAAYNGASFENWTKRALSHEWAHFKYEQLGRPPIGDLPIFNPFRGEWELVPVEILSVADNWATSHE